MSISLFGKEIDKNSSNNRKIINKFTIYNLESFLEIYKLNKLKYEKLIFFFSIKILINKKPINGVNTKYKYLKKSFKEWCLFKRYSPSIPLWLNGIII